MSDYKTVTFVPSGRGKAQNPPDPRFPVGHHFPAPEGAERTCTVMLPYPAPECGWFHVDCERCGFSLLITAAGRVDDPVSVELPCIVTKRVDTYEK